MKLDFVRSEDFRGTTLLRQRDGLAYAYETTHAAADADGAPNAYHPDDLHKHCGRDPHVGLDCLANAGYPDSDWWADVLIADPDDGTKAFVQQHGPTKGFYVAATALRDPAGSRFDPATFVDSTTVPYVVSPTGFTKLPKVGRPGDVGFATHLASSASTAFIVGDAGGGKDARLGEGSIALFAALGYPGANPRTGAGLPRDPVQYIVFPGSRRAGAAIWPRTNEDVHGQVMDLLRDTAGIS